MQGWRRWLFLSVALLAGCGARSSLDTERSDGGEGRTDGRSVARDAAARDTGPVEPRTSCTPDDLVIRYGAGGSPSPRSVGVQTRVRIATADVYFLIDTTRSMSEEIAAIRSAVLDLIDALRCTASDRPCMEDGDCESGEICNGEGRCAIAPDVARCLPDLHVGVGRYAGGPDSYIHLLDISPPSDATRSAIPATADGVGNNDALFNSVRCCFGRGECSPRGCDGVDRDCVGYRPDALPILVTITDEGDECVLGLFDPECDSGPDAAVAAIRTSEAVFVGIDADSTGTREATPFLEALAAGSGSVDAAGAPLVFAGAGADVVEAVREGLASVAGTPLRLEAQLVEIEGDDGDGLAFVDHVAVDRASAGCFPYEDVEDTDGDGRPDAIPAAEPGTTACFEIVARDLPRPSPDPGSVIRIEARILAGGATVAAQTVCFEGF